MYRSMLVRVKSAEGWRTFKVFLVLVCSAMSLILMSHLSMARVFASDNATSDESVMLDVTGTEYDETVNMADLDIDYQSPGRPNADECAQYVEWLSTPLRDGNTMEAVRLDWVPMVKALASGTVPGDGYAWSFEDAPFYADAEDMATAKYRFDTHTANMQPRALAALLCEASIGVYDLYSLSYSLEIHQVDEGVWRCAMIGVVVTSWRSPYGAVCSRSEALEYYNECQERIGLVVSNLRAAKQENGEELTNAQKLKWVHDWLINSANYAYDELDKYYDEEGGADKYRHIFNEYGAIVEGRAVCQSYAYAFEAIVEELVRQTGADIRCEEAHTEDHSWNRVKIDDKWYHVDVTNDDYGEIDFLADSVSTKYFLFSDYCLTSYYNSITSYDSITSIKEKATSREYEGVGGWPRYKKNISEYTVIVNNPSQDNVYESYVDLPSIDVAYGSDVLPKYLYQVEKVYNEKNGRVETKIVPAMVCKALDGELEGPTFTIFVGEISGNAQSKTKYKLGKKKAVCPFDKEFKPFAARYTYDTKPELAKSTGNSLTLKNGVDYTVKYKRNKKVGWATAVIEMKGAYAGKVTIRYRIVK